MSWVSIHFCPSIMAVCHATNRLRWFLAHADLLATSAGGTRHILKDFQDQLQTLRAQMALLTAQNEGLREKLVEADTKLTVAAASKAQLQQELLSQSELLQHAQVLHSCCSSLWMMLERSDKVQRRFLLSSTSAVQRW